MQSYNKILIFGGSFDPIHNGHINILQKAINKINPDKVLIVPNFISPHKKESFITPDQKLEMILLATNNIKNIDIVDYEIKNKEPSYFYKTLDFIKNKYKANNYFLLMGQDQFHNFNKWYKYEYILNQVNKIYIFKRQKHLLCTQCNKNKNDFKNKIEFIFSLKKYNISSTNIRENIVKQNWLNPNVLKYINDNGIYGINRIKKYNKSTRFAHSIRVAQYAVEIAKIYDESLCNFAYCAGIYHDIAKDLKQDVQEKIAKKLKIKNYVSWKVLHPYIGSYMMKKQYLFTNELVLNAVYRHTLPLLDPNTKLSLLDKIIYIADKLEPNRTNEDCFLKPINYYRELVKKDIDKAFYELLNDLQSNKNNFKQ